MDEILNRLDVFQSTVFDSDQQEDKTPEAIALPLLGLFGETGSLLSEAKKVLRERDVYQGYKENIVEELGDALWYMANISSRYRFKFSDIFAGHSEPDAGIDGAELKIQSLQAELLKLANRVSALIDHVMNKNPSNIMIKAGLQSIAECIFKVSYLTNVPITDAIDSNIEKIFSKYPRPVDMIYPRLFDEEESDEDEKLPRYLTVSFVEKTMPNGKKFVIQKIDDLIIGDRLSDNMDKEDDYRFHDVFHLAYAAVLGWSPVLRALLRRKRKSNPEKDENQDGARAIIIEEGISTFIFNRASGVNFYADSDKVDFSTLKMVRSFCKGYEVQDCPYWQWEKAILAGYSVFRDLKRCRGGHVTLDLNRRRITFEGTKK